MISKLILLPSVMPLSSQIPQDIIDIIIDELKDDDHTLKSCATVSHSFLQPSRRNLFYAIYIRDVHTLAQMKRLRDILSAESGISLFVRELNVVVCDDDADEESFVSWLANDEALADVLRMVPRLQSLSWRVESCSTLLDWEHGLSDALRSALVDLFQSPCLSTVRIFNIHHFPLSVIGAFTHVKKLILELIYFKEHSAPHSPLAQLEVLHLHVGFDLWRDPRSECFIPTSSTFPNLRCLSIGSGYSRITTFVQRIITSTTSIERVQWSFYEVPTDDPTAIDLGVMKNLKFLTFKCFLLEDGISNPDGRMYYN